mmetsp:Transcript_52909/g.140438  ORF Transcript_52909/g.140438 Transcript_52909/m.140438 type:complete len:200 (+) Transcript_52909:121-720(+)
MNTASTMMPSIGPTRCPRSMSLRTWFSTSRAEMVLRDTSPASFVSTSAMLTSTRSRLKVWDWEASWLSRKPDIRALRLCGAPWLLRSLCPPEELVALERSPSAAPSAPRAASSTMSMRPAEMAKWCARPWPRVTLSRVSLCRRCNTKNTECRISCWRGAMTFSFQPCWSTWSMAALPLVSCWCSWNNFVTFSSFSLSVF